MSVCRCCNRPLKPSEIVYYPEHGTHEDFCTRCKDKFFEEYIAAGGDPEMVGRTAYPKEGKETDG